MEEFINEISKEVLEELKKSRKSAYPLYYKNLFVKIAKDKNVLDELNPKLLCEDEKISENILHKTKNTIEVVSNVSKEIKEDSENLIEEVAPLQLDNIKETIIKFSSGLINKVNTLEETVNNLHKELDKAYKELLIDPLTKAYNRKALNNDLNFLLEKGKDRDLDLVVAAIDLDLFKEINDTYGHLVGDFVLIKIVSILKKHIRSIDKIYRYGGDEFIIIFNRMSLQIAESIIKRIIDKIEHTKLKYKDDIISVTISVGLTQHKKGDSFDDIIKRADEALYEAKKNRDCYKIKE